LLPLNKPIENCVNILNFNLHYEKGDIQSHILSLLLEFILILDARETFDTFRRMIPLRVTPFQIRPKTELKIYLPDFIDATTIFFESIELDYEYFKKMHNQRLLLFHSSEIDLSMIDQNRPNFLVLISSHFRDRYFSNIWRR
jgi:hypothetical protein